MRLALAALSVLMASSCAADTGVVTVFAAASLGGVMEEQARAFEGAHPQRHVRVSIAGSQILSRQIEAGAPADIFVPASAEHAAALADRLEEVRTLACNELVLVVPQRSQIRSFSDLPRASRIVIGTPEVPIGAYTEAMLARAPAELRRAVMARVVSRELDARQVLAKVRIGEADAAIVYRTDALAAGSDVVIVPIDDELRVSTLYVVAAVRNGHPREERNAGRGEASEGARAFVEWLTSERGREILEARGFAACPDEAREP